MLRLRLSTRPRVEGIEESCTSWLEIRHVTGRDREAVFKRCRRNGKVKPLVANPMRQTAPAVCDGNIHRKNFALIRAQNHIQPGRDILGERGVQLPLPFDASLDFTRGGHADEQIL